MQEFCRILLHFALCHGFLRLIYNINVEIRKSGDFGALHSFLRRGIFAVIFFENKKAHPPKAQKPREDKLFIKNYKNQGVSLVYHQFRRNCISSKRSFVYHQVAEEYIFGDDIHAKAWWYTPAAMICQVCDLDKKILQKMYPFLQYFLVQGTGLEPAC